MSSTKRILVTGGAGFVGSTLAIRLKTDDPSILVTGIDNLRRRGSEFNVRRLKEHDVHFIHGDIRQPADLEDAGRFDVLIECSAEPSVLAGYSSSHKYLIDTNLNGTVNCLDACKKNNAAILFLSTSRVYPYKEINELKYQVKGKRFQVDSSVDSPGVTDASFDEKFPMTGARSLYGATKYGAEILIQEYIDAFDMRGVINRCGVITGPWQMGKVDQGFAVLWMARHYWKKALAYIGYGGKGHQVRDILHAEDLYRLIKTQLGRIEQLEGDVYNVGGGIENSVSLAEFTDICRNITGNTIEITATPETRPVDIPYYVTNNTKVTDEFGWKPTVRIEEIATDIHDWIKAHEELLRPYLNI